MYQPKAELHVHLEGTISPNLFEKLAKRNKITIRKSLISEDGSRYTYDNFLDFLKAYDQVAAVIKCPRDYYDLTFDYLKETAEKGGIYVEMMYSPEHAEQSSGIPSKEHLEAIGEAISHADSKYGIKGRILMTAVRHFGPDSALKVAKEALKYPFPFVVGFGLGGDEYNFPPSLFKRAYETAHDGGLFCTVHAGEFAGHEGMDEAMATLPIQRIGHGVRAIESEDTIKRLIDKNIALEICPSSNIALGLFPNLDAHPLSHFLEKGVIVSLGSDDPPFFGTTLDEEYKRVQGHYRFSDEQMMSFTKMAIEASFVDDATKKELLNRIKSTL